MELKGLLLCVFIVVQLKSITQITDYSNLTIPGVSVALKDIPILVRADEITGHLVLKDYSDMLRAARAIKEKKQRRVLIKRHVSVRESYLKALLVYDAMPQEIPLINGNISFWSMVYQCRRFNPVVFERQTNSYIYRLHFMLQDVLLRGEKKVRK
ncbi:hypothetical protein HOM50_05090 [bacterium]|jgi:hypothetical protein|nr:hypothetical protein [bacterium]MBT5015757.1 hypothetical protein [bacterium]